MHIIVQSNTKVLTFVRILKHPFGLEYLVFAIQCRKHVLSYEWYYSDNLFSADIVNKSARMSRVSLYHTGPENLKYSSCCADIHLISRSERYESDADANHRKYCWFQLRSTGASGTYTRPCRSKQSGGTPTTYDDATQNSQQYAIALMLSICIPQTKQVPWFIVVSLRWSPPNGSAAQPEHVICSLSGPGWTDSQKMAPERPPFW